jgi:hypothetical protein
MYGDVIWYVCVCVLSISVPRDDVRPLKIETIEEENKVGGYNKIKKQRCCCFSLLVSLSLNIAGVRLNLFKTHGSSRSGLTSRLEMA